jgi:adenylate cyclase
MGIARCALEVSIGQAGGVRDNLEPGREDTSELPRPVAPVVTRAPATSALPPQLVAIDQTLFPRPPIYTARELAAAAGVELEVAERLWRAMGFTMMPEDERLFSDDDLEALGAAVHALKHGTSLDDVVYETRVTAAALARAAEVWSDEVVKRIDGMRAMGLDDEQIAEGLHGQDFPDIDHLVGYFYRRQLKAAMWRKLAVPDHPAKPTPLTVGFLDLVRFTALTEDIDEEALAELIDRFESVVHDRVTDRGGRIVKMIGDEVMFVSSGMEEAVDIALRLVHDFAEDESVPPARAGLAWGSVLAHGGDYFGPVVNLAARMVDVARPSTVVVSHDIHDALALRPELHWRRLPPKRLKGIGRTALWAVSDKRRRS